jgi:hypothetical protein
MKSSLRLLPLTLLLLLTTGCVSLHREIAFPEKLQFNAKEPKMHKTVGLIIAPEVLNRVTEYNEDVAMGSSKVTVRYGEGLKKNVVNAFEARFTGVVLLADKTHLTPNLDYVVELSFGSQTDYEYSERGAGARRNITVDLQWAVADAKLKTVADGHAIGKTECYKWECNTDSTTYGESAEAVLLKDLFVPGYLLNISNHLQKLYTLAFTRSLRSALSKTTESIALGVAPTAPAVAAIPPHS